MDKLLTFSTRNERGVFAYVLGRDTNHLVKTAAEFHPKVAQYIREAKQIPGKTQLLLTALGAGEIWGQNSNGDFFTRDSISHEGDDYGYKTFLTTAKLFKHHINKDPLRSFGEVLLSIYNPVYHRVELIITIDHKTAPEIIEKIENGEPVDFSMGCLKPDTLIKMADLTYKKVSEIKGGDKVINAMGTISEVDYPHNHPHKGEWYDVKVRGLLDGVQTTEEHPWLVLEPESYTCNRKKGGDHPRQCSPRRVNKKYCIGCENLDREYKHTWKRADELKIGDYIGTPINRNVAQFSHKDYVPYLLGLYLAEGHITQDGYIELNVNSQEYFLFEKVKNILKEESFSVLWKDRVTSNCSRINIYSKDLGKKLYQLAGKGAHLKTLSQEVMEWPLDKQMQFLGGYFDGDGCLSDKGLLVSSCNKILLDQIFNIMLRNDIVSTQGKIHHKPSTVVDKNTIEYRLDIPFLYCSKFYRYTVKAKTLKDHKPKKINEKRFISGDHFWSPIKSITITECNEEVYNIAIKGSFDESSYTVNNLGLHNCRVPWDECNICGHRAKTQKEYCDHAKFYLGRIHPGTGKVVYVINRFPKFFDISYVTIGADRIAKGLLKVASLGNVNYEHMGSYVNVSSAELAEKSATLYKEADIEKEIPGNEAPSSVTHIGDAIRAISEVKAHEKEIPNDVLDGISSKFNLSQIMTTMAALGIIPKPQEFQRIFLMGNGNPELANELHSRNICFDPGMCDSPTVEMLNHLDISPSQFKPELMQSLGQFVPDRSYAAPHLLKRIIIIEKTAASNNFKFPIFYDSSKHDIDARPKVGIMPIMLLVSGLYAALAQKAPELAATRLGELISKYPGLAATLASSVPLVFNNVMGDHGKGNYVEGLEPEIETTSQQLEHERHKPFAKIAGSNMRASMGRIMMGVPAAYMASGILQKHKNLNPESEEGNIKRFVRRNPDIIGGLVAVDGLMAASGKGSHGLFKQMFKHASVEDYVTNAVTWPLAFGSKALPGRMLGGFMDQAIIEGSKKLLSKKQNADKIR